MAVIRNTASALRKGKVGNETYYVSLNKQIVRVAQNDSNYGEAASRTQRQQNNRVKWANLVNFYKLSKTWMKKAFETKKSNQTDYNRFMQLNLSASRIYLTREAAMAGAVVADSFILSQGSLRSISIVSHDDHWDTDIALGTLAIGSNTTVAQFSEAVINANNWATENMQISFISYQQDVDQYGFPVLVCTAYEVTLDLNDTTILRNHLPDFCSQSDSNGFLGTSDKVSIGGFAYVLSQTVGGKTLVSTQSLIQNNAQFIAQYSSAQALARATASYGVQEDVFLDSGSEMVSPAGQPLYISGIVLSSTGKTYGPSAYAPTRAELGGSVTINLSAALPDDVTVLASRFYVQQTAQPGSLASAVISADRKSITGTVPTSTNNSLVIKLDVALSNGLYEIVFDTSGTEHD